MQFSLNMFSDLLSEFQKYLSDRIPRAIYFTLGLVVAILGTIAVYIVGWNTVTAAWNRLDIFFRVALGIAAGVVFLILAYVLSGLQATVERWFQGEIRFLPFRLGKQTGQLRRHRAIWQGRDAAFQGMTDLYSEIMTVLDEVTQWGQNQTLGLTVLQTARTLPRYHVITTEDLETIGVDSVPDGAFREMADALGMMVQHPLDAGVPVMKADIVGLPSSLHNAMIVAIAISAEVVPIGLVPGDMVTIYAYTDGANQVAHLEASLVVAVEQMCREKSNGKKVDLIHLTLAVSPTVIEQFMLLASEKILGVVRLISPSVSTTSTGTSVQHNQNAPANTAGQASTTGDITQIPLRIEKLRQDYDAGLRWLKQIQQGISASLDIHPYLSTIDETFTSINQLRNAPATSSDEQVQLAAWRKEVNDYRNKWIRLLQDAFKEIEYRIDQNQKAFSLYYPSSIEKVASTPIGNVFQAVDSYCDDLYGLDTVLVLPRLQTVMTQSTRDLLAKAHDQLALFEWLYLGSIFTGVVGTILSALTHHYLLALLLWLLALPLAQLIFYPSAFMAALDYAAALRLTFDRERGKVISMVGFSLSSPIDQEQEKALWKQIQQWWVYGTPPGNYTLNMEGMSSEKSS